MARKVLVVDDEEPIRNVLRKALEVAGFTVQAVGSAEEALKSMARDPAAVVFLDLMLPGMNGVELGRRIRQESPLVCLIAVTGHVSLFELANCREVGFDDYFAKPFQLAEVVRAAEAAFERIERWKAHR